MMGNQLRLAWSRSRAQSSRVAGGNDDHRSASNSCGLLHPHDVLYEILLRIPAKPLRRLRCVSRSWCALLSDPTFLAAHAARHPSAQLLAVTSRGIFEEETELMLLDASSSSCHVVHRVKCRNIGCLPPHHNPKMRAHHGLVCLVSANHRLRVLHPATGLVTILPNHAGQTGNTCFVLGRTAAASATGGGGGTYKVLSITVDSYNTERACKVLTLGDSSSVWREVRNPPAIIQSTLQWTAAAANGVVYILAVRLHNRTLTDCIVAFDLDTEQWSQDLIQCPPALPDHSNKVSTLTELGDHLVAVSGFVGSDTCLHVFHLTDGSHGEKELWQPLCTVPTSLVQFCHGNQLMWLKVLCVLNCGRVAFVVWSGVDMWGKTQEQPWVLRVYDPRTKACEDVTRLFNPTDVAMGMCTWNLMCP